MTITAADFWLARKTAATDSWGGSLLEELDTDRLASLVDTPDPNHSDLAVALALMDLVRDDFQLSGTSGDHRIRDAGMRTAIRALESTSARPGYPFSLPFRDHAAWKSYWVRQGAPGSGGWQARRNLLSDLFDASYATMTAALDRAPEVTLVEAASEHERLGWPEVDTEVGELRRHFRAARTSQDYRAVGNDSVHITEAMSREVYVHERHTPAGEEEPPVTKTKLRFDRYIDSQLPGSDNTELRKLARATIEMAQAVKHRGTPTRREAGLAADAVILLANMLRRLAEDE